MTGRQQVRTIGSMANVHDVAAYILDEHGPMSTMKLQKLVYYSQAWHLVWDEEPLYPEPIEAWANGPVVFDLFSAHRGQFSVQAPWPHGDPSKLRRNERETVDAVLRSYGALDGRQLSTLTHGEAPWREAREGLSPTERSRTPIDLDRMQDFYGALDDDTTAQPVASLEWPEEPF